jgi:hypothetical protein
VRESREPTAHEALHKGKIVAAGVKTVDTITSVVAALPTDGDEPA